SEESATVFNEEEFAKLRGDDTLFFRLGYKNLYPIAMKEPQTMGVQDVLAEMNAALASEKFPDYSIKFQYGNGESFTKEIPRDYTIDLPYSVKRYFEIPSDTLFTKSKRVQVGHDVVIQVEQIQEEEEGEDIIVPVTSSRKRLLVVLNVVESQFYKNQHVQLLAETGMSSILITEIEKEFMPEGLSSGLKQRRREKTVQTGGGRKRRSGRKSVSTAVNRKRGIKKGGFRNRSRKNSNWFRKQ
ncbi:unnamed protein product, partial [Allacma fusca]